MERLSAVFVGVVGMSVLVDVGEVVSVLAGVAGSVVLMGVDGATVSFFSVVGAGEAGLVASPEFFSRNFLPISKTQPGCILSGCFKQSLFSRLKVSVSGGWIVRVKFLCRLCPDGCRRRGRRGRCRTGLCSFDLGT